MVRTRHRELLAILRVDPLAVNERLVANQPCVLETELQDSLSRVLTASGSSPLLTAAVLAIRYFNNMVLLLSPPVVALKAECNSLDMAAQPFVLSVGVT